MELALATAAHDPVLARFVLPSASLALIYRAVRARPCLTQTFHPDTPCDPCQFAVANPWGGYFPGWWPRPQRQHPTVFFGSRSPVHVPHLVLAHFIHHQVFFFTPCNRLPSDAMTVLKGIQVVEQAARGLAQSPIVSLPYRRVHARCTQSSAASGLRPSCRTAGNERMRCRSSRTECMAAKSSLCCSPCATA